MIPKPKECIICKVPLQRLVIKKIDNGFFTADSIKRIVINIADFPIEFDIGTSVSLDAFCPQCGLKYMNDNAVEKLFK